MAVKSIQYFFLVSWLVSTAWEHWFLDISGTCAVCRRGTVKEGNNYDIKPYYRAASQLHTLQFQIWIARPTILVPANDRLLPSPNPRTKQTSRLGQRSNTWVSLRLLFPCHWPVKSGKAHRIGKQLYKPFPTIQLIYIATEQPSFCASIRSWLDYRHCYRHRKIHGQGGRT